MTESKMFTTPLNAKKLRFELTSAFSHDQAKIIKQI